MSALPYTTRIMVVFVAPSRVRVTVPGGEDGPASNPASCAKRGTANRGLATRQPPEDPGGAAHPLLISHVLAGWSRAGKIAKRKEERRKEGWELLNPLTLWGPRSRTWRYVDPESAKRKTSQYGTTMNHEP